MKKQGVYCELETDIFMLFILILGLKCLIHDTLRKNQHNAL